MSDALDVGPPPPPPDATTRDPIDELPPVLVLNVGWLEFPPSPTVIVYGPGDNETGSEILIGAGTPGSFVLNPPAPPAPPFPHPPPPPPATTRNSISSFPLETVNVPEEVKT